MTTFDQTDLLHGFFGSTFAHVVHHVANKCDSKLRLETVTVCKFNIALDESSRLADLNLLILLVGQCRLQSTHELIVVNHVVTSHPFIVEKLLRVRSEDLLKLLWILSVPRLEQNRQFTSFLVPLPDTNGDTIADIIGIDRSEVSFVRTDIRDHSIDEVSRVED